MGVAWWLWPGYMCGAWWDSNSEVLTDLDRTARDQRSKIQWGQWQFSVQFHVLDKSDSSKVSETNSELWHSVRAMLCKRKSPHMCKSSPEYGTEALNQRVQLPPLDLISASNQSSLRPNSSQVSSPGPLQNSIECPIKKRTLYRFDFGGFKNWKLDLMGKTQIDAM